MIKGLHHNAYRCRDSEETRRFYEDFLGLRLAGRSRSARPNRAAGPRALHTFYELDDGSYLAFFETPDMPFEFKPQHDFDLHIALEVERPVLEPMMAKGKRAGIEVRGISDHGFIDSIYFRDPNGYVIELTAKRAGPRREMDPAANGARAKLDRWQAAKRATATRPADVGVGGPAGGRGGRGRRLARGDARGASLSHHRRRRGRDPARAALPRSCRRRRGTRGEAAAARPRRRFTPDLRTRLVERLVRRFGPRATRGILATMNLRGLSVYGQPDLPPPRPATLDEMAERRRGSGTGNLRAAVFGANDGLVSNASLMFGVAGATDGTSAVLARRRGRPPRRRVLDGGGRVRIGDLAARGVRASRSSASARSS